MEIYLIRHFATKDNAERRYPQSDLSPLLPLERSETLRRRLDAVAEAAVERVIVSPARRAVETAGIYFPDYRLVVEPALAELDFGRLAGKTADELAGDQAYRTWVDGGCLAAPPGGEAPEALAERVEQAFRRHLADAENDGLSRLAFVSHAGPAGALHRLLFGSRPFAFHLDPGGVLKVIMKHDYVEAEILF